MEHEVSKNIFMIAVGKEIFRLRKKRGLTGKQLAEKLNVSQQQISRYERGVCNINVDTLFVILHELDCSLSNFFSAVYLNVNDTEKKLVLIILICFYLHLLTIKVRMLFQ
ncbi:helix-turn-helix domain-containing protein [Providencia stuartii]|uniref:helix-turn-helix domain-containing protein n=1 Tax=Providencia stuartii TaxID=588 RepID=UPI0024AABA5C|nr:helix-turn-helix transcriptional regulator [Providencia stuartii]MCX3070385.1 helix-turn-helix transcriptional regulator [Providencia stuartii]MDQ5990297.1 helix-turn-helix transcriptional regulator [Providencia stuartii]